MVFSPATLMVLFSDADIDVTANTNNNSAFVIFFFNTFIIIDFNGNYDLQPYLVFCGCISIQRYIAILEQASSEFATCDAKLTTCQKGVS